MSTSTVRRHVGDLERQLGFDVFERGCAFERLTAEGERVMPQLRRVLSLVEPPRS